VTVPESLDSVLADLGPDARWGRVVVVQLAAGHRALGELVRASGLSRRTVERLVAAFDAARPTEVEPALDRVRLPHLALDADTVEIVSTLIERAPRARPVLDQVPADAATVVARATLLRDQFAIDGPLLLLGDHDLTSIAAALVMPDVEVVVVDIDDPLLEYLDGIAQARGLAVRTVWADLRDGLPEPLQGTAALVFSDPPYSADGVEVFLERGLAALHNRARGRVVIAYGAGDHRPDLALAVQDRINRLRVVIEAIHPSFNSYPAADAIGGWSDLYVCRPTAATWRRLGRASRSRRLYTRGPQAEEAATGLPSPIADAAAALVPGGRVVDLRREPDELLLRALRTADRPTAVIVRNHHRDITGEQSQRALLDLVEPRVTVRFHRSTPDSTTAIVVAYPTGEGPVARVDHTPRHRMNRPDVT